jgi:hypothetical protein
LATGPTHIHVVQLTPQKMPLSFMTSIFGMNAFEIDEDKMSIYDELKFICKILPIEKEKKIKTLLPDPYIFCSTAS